MTSPLQGQPHQFDTSSVMKTEKGATEGAMKYSKVVQHQGRDYTVTITVNDKLAPDAAESKLNEAIQKTMTLATAFKLGKTDKHGETISSLKLTTDGKVSLNNQAGKTFTHDDALARLDSRSRRTEEKKAMNTPAGPDKLLKLEGKIANLQAAKFILGLAPKEKSQPLQEESKEEEIEIQTNEKSAHSPLPTPQEPSDLDDDLPPDFPAPSPPSEKQLSPRHQEIADKLRQALKERDIH